MCCVSKKRKKEKALKSVKLFFHAQLQAYHALEVSRPTHRVVSCPHIGVDENIGIILATATEKLTQFNRDGYLQTN